MNLGNLSKTIFWVFMVNIGPFWNVPNLLYVLVILPNVILDLLNIIGIL